MFDDEDYLKQKFRDFLKDEIEELQQHKLRFFALFFSFLLSMALIFTEDSGKTIEINNVSRIEETPDVEEEENIKTNKKTSNNEIISVKKGSNESKREKVVAVLGANSDKLYIGDPFQSEEELLPEVQQKSIEKAAIPQQVPIIPPQLPPIPDQIQNLPPIPSAVPQIIEPVLEPIKTVEQEFILTGTAVNFDKKSAVVQKISTVQGQSERVENLILSVGDSLEGHQIVDITPSAVLFDDGHRIKSNYLGDNAIIYAENGAEISDIPEDYEKISINPVSSSDSDIPIIPDALGGYEQELIGKDDVNIPDIVIEKDAAFEDDKNLIKIEEQNLDLNSSTADKLPKSDTDSTDIEFPVDNDVNTVSVNNNDVPFNVQGDFLVVGNNSP